MAKPTADFETSPLLKSIMQGVLRKPSPPSSLPEFTKRIRTCKLHVDSDVKWMGVFFISQRAGDMPAPRVYKSPSLLMCMWRHWSHIHKALSLQPPPPPHTHPQKLAGTPHGLKIKPKKKPAVRSFLLYLRCRRRVDTERKGDLAPWRRPRPKEPALCRTFVDAGALYEPQTQARTANYFKTSGINWQLSQVSGKNPALFLLGAESGPS